MVGAILLCLITRIDLLYLFFVLLKSQTQIEGITDSDSLVFIDSFGALLVEKKPFAEDIIVVMFLQLPEQVGGCGCLMYLKVEFIGGLLIEQDIEGDILLGGVRAALVHIMPSNFIRYVEWNISTVVGRSWRGGRI